ncbi:hypothetical protein H0H92_006664 [Tricholoma furcatifolium]|nr:hypothetical protein H0H92_006664 [Tricholoma furcatifolium]
MSTGVEERADNVVPLAYSIVGSSAHSGQYVAENILVDRSTDQLSRWSGKSQNNANQWITLRVESLAILSCSFAED